MSGVWQSFSIREAGGLQGDCQGRIIFVPSSFKEPVGWEPAVGHVSQRGGVGKGEPCHFCSCASLKGTLSTPHAITACCKTRQTFASMWARGSWLPEGVAHSVLCKTGNADQTWMWMGRSRNHRASSNFPSSTGTWWYQQPQPLWARFYLLWLLIWHGNWEPIQRGWFCILVCACCFKDSPSYVPTTILSVFGTAAYCVCFRVKTQNLLISPKARWRLLRY